MRKNFGIKSWLLPQPVLIVGTYDEAGNADAMNAAWGGMYDFDKVVISLSPHQTTDNILKKKAFTLSFGSVGRVLESDFVGIVSAKKYPDKLKVAGLHTRKAEHVDAPVIDEFPVTVECTLAEYDDGIVVGQIVNVSADESVLDGEGNIDLGKLDLVVFDPVAAAYRRVGEKVARAFSDGKKLLRADMTPDD